MAKLKLIVGLGNPGKDYEKSRHNLGFRVVSELAKGFKLRFKKSEVLQSLILQAKIKNENVLLCLPLVFMNNSGEAVKKIIARKKINFKDLLIVLDDVNLQSGSLRIRAAGSSGGHNGLNSIIESLGATQFSRLRLGIGITKRNPDLTDFVLASFSKEEERSLLPVIKKAKDCILSWIKQGVIKTMNEFNQNNDITYGVRH
ncbi:MAG: aminoacyl-tRNA hydrolase [Candidatus Omnitrophota bacterium]|nr:aminoacyl-tRNA hydrolase [Candidatus Omnitrophota bacterium]